MVLEKICGYVIDILYVDKRYKQFKLEKGLKLLISGGAFFKKGSTVVISEKANEIPSFLYCSKSQITKFVSENFRF